MQLYDEEKVIDSFCGHWAYPYIETTSSLVDEEIKKMGQDVEVELAKYKWKSQETQVKNEKTQTNALEAAKEQ